MAEYKVEVDLSDLFDDMTINEQKNFLVEKFSSLPRLWKSTSHILMVHKKTDNL